MPGSNVYRYHVMIDGRRTSVSLDTIVADYLAAVLYKQPGSPDGFSAVRKWVQAELDGCNGLPSRGLSQWLLGRAMARLASDEAKVMHQLWMA